MHGRMYAAMTLFESSISHRCAHWDEVQRGIGRNADRARARWQQKPDMPSYDPPWRLQSILYKLQSSAAVTLRIANAMRIGYISCELDTYTY